MSSKTIDKVSFIRQRVMVRGLEEFPGSLSEEPYAISAAVELRSVLREVRIPNSIRGRESIQALGVGWVLRALLSWQWNL